MQRRSFRAAKAAEWNGTVGIFRAEVNWALEVVSPDCLLRRSPLSAGRFPCILSANMLIARTAILVALLATASLRAGAPVEQQILDGIKSPEISVVHLWAPWCSNCQAELKSGGWLKEIKDNPHVKFYFVSVWNNGEDGRQMLQKFQIADQPNVTILADPGPRSGDKKIRQFAGMPVSWIPTTWIYKNGDLRYALNYGEVRFDVLQQFLEDSKSEWSHKGEPSMNTP
jgi:thiol-disulfide isomerase/thioredoxin